MGLPAHARRALVATALLAGFLALLDALAAWGVAASPLALARAPIAVVHGLVVAASAACALSPAPARRAILLAAAVLAAPLVLGGWSIAWLAGNAAVIALARAKVHIAVRMIAAASLWTALPVARVVWLDGQAQADTILLAIVWAGQLYSALYLIVEREREPAASRSTVASDAGYLLALPRLIVPFFQPISPRQLARSERAGLPRGVVQRAAGLAAYTAGLTVAIWALGEAARHTASGPLGHGIAFCRHYARASSSIFTAIVVFRLLGWALPSGFRTPFLSRSFAEFFRRFNYYVRDAVLSVFYYPLLGRLRHALPPRAATIASAYLGIFVGSFLLHDLLVPMATTLAPRVTLAAALDPVRVITMVTLWTLIIVPTAGLGPRRAPPASRARRALEIALFNLVYFALWFAQSIGRGRR